MMPKTLTRITLALALGTSISAHSATIVCSGTVETLSFHSSNTGGLFMLKLSSMNVPVYFCDAEQPFSAPGSGYSISPATCRVLYGTFLSAKMSGLTVNNLHFDGDQVPASCDAWANWQSANIRHYLY